MEPGTHSFSYPGFSELWGTTASPFPSPALATTDFITWVLEIRIQVPCACVTSALPPSHVPSHKKNLKYHLHVSVVIPYSQGPKMTHQECPHSKHYTFPRTRTSFNEQSQPFGGGGGGIQIRSSGPALACVSQLMCVYVCGGIRWHLAEMGPLFLPCGSQGSNSGSRGLLASSKT